MREDNLDTGKTEQRHSGRSRDVKLPKLQFYFTSHTQCEYHSIVMG